MVSRGEVLHRLPEKLAAGRAALLESGWLSRTPSDFQQAVLDIAVWRTADAGSEFVHAGDRSGGLVGIASGISEFSIETGHPDTRFIHLGLCGFWVGYRPLLGMPRSVSAVARTDVLWVLLPRHAMQQLLAEKPQYWREVALMADLTGHTAIQIMVDLTRHHGLTRAAAALLRLAGCRNDDPIRMDQLEIHVSQADIAALAVMSRNTLGTYLSDLARRNLIEIGYRTIRILDVAGLRTLLDSEE